MPGFSLAIPLVSCVEGDFVRHFDYFLFENFDADDCVQHALNPRSFLNASADGIMSYIASFPPSACSYQACGEAFDVQSVERLIAGGVLRREGYVLFFDTPVFLREDEAVLRCEVSAAAYRLSKKIQYCAEQIRGLCSEIQNGFPIELNLYHILCGMIFDGIFFDFLEQRGTVSTSRSHSSGLDYLSVIYEKCPELNEFSDGLLCSYNRFADERCSLQSFGDANGSRQDFYRFFRLMESGKVPASFDRARSLYLTCHGMTKREILDQVIRLIKTGQCAAPVSALLEHFGYVSSGKICVPVYSARENDVIERMAKAMETEMGNAFVEELTALSEKVNITARHHGVSSGEIANELYHILFGMVNEHLVKNGFVAAPPQKDGEGRYLRCIQLF